jgi:HlyD family secretion protein
MKKWILIVAPIALVLALGGAWFGTRTKKATGRAGQTYEFTTISRGSIESVVSSSGTLATVSTVSVLSQMSGRVEKVFADYNDHVKKGMVLASLNTDMLKLQEQESRSAVKKAQAQYDLQLVDFQNKAKLAEKGLVSDYELKSSKASLEVLAAELSSAQSALEVIQTEITQYALITSPIDGIVLDRNIDEGQSVVDGSSANSSSLFTLAEDLSRMEIKAEVDELDISSIKIGQEVRFTVEAWPSLSFSGKVHQIRLVPKTTDNVVNYYVMIEASNPEGKLLPGMTATVQFIKEKKSDVLVVRSAAFRFQPPELSAEQIQKLTFMAGLADLPEAERQAAEKAFEEQEKISSEAAANKTDNASKKGLTGMMLPPRPPQRGSKNTGANGAAAPDAAAGPNKKPLWYLDGQGKPAVLLVATGTSDGTNTELLEADGLVGKTVILKVKTE